LNQVSQFDFKSIPDSRPPDFTLLFEEGFEPGKSLKCWRLKQFSVADQTDYLLVYVDEALDRKKYGFADSEAHLLILAPRHQGDSLFGPVECPLYVNVLFPVIAESSVENVVSRGWMPPTETFFIAFGKTQLANSAYEAHLGVIRRLPQQIQ
jgi:hypothetical protein